jgi:hypothetical protein
MAQDDEVLAEDVAVFVHNRRPSAIAASDGEPAPAFIRVATSLDGTFHKPRPREAAEAFDTEREARRQKLRVENEVAAAFAFELRRYSRAHGYSLRR